MNIVIEDNNRLRDIELYNELTTYMQRHHGVSTPICDIVYDLVYRDIETCFDFVVTARAMEYVELLDDGCCIIIVEET
jgi:hypothetical protein